MLDGQDQDIAATLELALTPNTAAPRRARAAVGDWLAQEPSEAPSGDDVRLLVTELVSNAVRHARIEDGERLHVRAWLRQTVLHLEVWNAGDVGPVAPGPPRLSDDAGAGGFGLNVVALLASDWGVHLDADGTTVWLELRTAPGAAS